MFPRLLTPFITLLCLFAFSETADTRPLKNLILQGNRIFTDEQIISKSGLSRSIDASEKAHFVTSRIKNFYRVRGYELAETYIVKNNKTEMKVFIDEGRLGKIVFLNINNLDFIRIRYDFRLKKKVFNRFLVRKELAYLKREFKFEEVAYRVREIKNYDKSFFQLDRDLKVPVIISKFIPYIETYAPRYILEIRIKKRKRKGSKTHGFRWRLDVSTNIGLAPEVQYYHKSLLGKDDRLKAGFVSGAMYGADMKFKNVPHITFTEIHTEYFLPPMLKDYFTPKVEADFYHSNKGRKDLGYEQFRFSKYRITASPGITLLKKLRLSLGFAYEHIDYDESISDPAEVLQVPLPHHSNYYIIKSEVSLDLVPFKLGNTINKSFSINYDAFLDGKNFHQLKLKGLYDFDLQRHDIFSVNFDFDYNFKTVPYVYEHSVSNSTFKGFQGTSWYSNNKSSLSLEYRFSIYRDFIYTGLFSEGTIFKGSGRDLKGFQGGIIAGLVVRIIVMDQYEWVVHGGQDWLVGTTKTQFNAYFSFFKRV